MNEITFDEYGYTDADDLCTPLVDRESEKPGGWIRRMSLLAVNKIEMSQLTVKQSLEDAKKSGYDVIGHKPLGNGRTMAYSANRVGLQKLAEAAIRIGKKTEEANALLERLKLDGVEEPAPDNSTLLGALSLSSKAESLRSIKELTDQGVKICTWKATDVIMASDLAEACGMQPKYVNRQIRTCAGRGELVENTDFFKLDDRATAGFCGVYDLHLSPAEMTNGVYLLTQMGTIKLVEHFRKDKSQALKDSVRLAASAMMDLERGVQDNIKSIPALVKALIESREQTEKNHRELMEEMEQTRETNMILCHKVEQLSCRIPEEVIKQAAISTTKEYLKAVICDGVESIPKGLIGRKERREKFFPGVNDDIVTAFLMWKDHPSETWLRKHPEGPVTTVSYVREGMDAMSLAFFASIKFSGVTECNYEFLLPEEMCKKRSSNKMRLRRKERDNGNISAADVRRELHGFLSKLSVANRHEYLQLIHASSLSTAN